MAAASAVAAAAVTATALSECRQRKNTTKNGTDGKSHKFLYRSLHRLERGSKVTLWSQNQSRTIFAVAIALLNGVAYAGR
jgi:hypothetical protein